MKKKYARKKKEHKDANRSGTSTKALEKAERGLQMYKFMHWMDRFIQPREGRTNIRSNVEKSNSNEEDDDEEMIPDENEIEDCEEHFITQKSSNQSRESDEEDEEEEGEVEEGEMGRQPINLEPPTESQITESQRKDSQRTEPKSSKSKKQKKQIQGANKASLIEEMEFSLMSKMNTHISNRERKRKLSEKEENQKKELSSEDIFCQALAMDLKQLPQYERCMAKHDLRNVLYKHQMAVMERQVQNYPFFGNGTVLSSPVISPSNRQQSVSNSFSSPPQTPLSQTPMPQTQSSWMS